MSFDIKASKWLNESKNGNFVFAPVDNVCNVQIFDELNMKTSSEMIGNLAQIIAQLPTDKQIAPISTEIVSPYDISPNVFVFDVAINSPGGDFHTYKSIASMFALAKSRGAIVRTHNIAYACSGASLLAIQGTPGYRIMTETAYNLIHYGSSRVSGNRENELAIATENNKKDRKQVFAVYKQFTKLTDKELNKYKSIESSGQLFAEQCLNKHLCDWILMLDGKLIGRNR